MTARSLAKDWVLAKREGRIPPALEREVLTLAQEDPQAYIEFVFERDEMLGGRGARSLMDAIDYGPQTLADDGEEPPRYLGRVWGNLILVSAVVSLVWAFVLWLATGERVGP